MNIEARLLALEMRPPEEEQALEKRVEALEERLAGLETVLVQSMVEAGKKAVRRKPKLRGVPCPACDGSGWCPKCGGGGSCGVCHDGRCVRCGGTGEIA
jgi:hypothetical protein